jgi:cytochrome P450
MMNDGPDHARLRQFLSLGFDATVVHSLRDLIQQSVDELLGGVLHQGYMDASGDFACLLPTYVPSPLEPNLHADASRVRWKSPRSVA